MSNVDRSHLLQLVRERCYREGDFVLASGRRSPFYLDGKAVLLDGNGARLIGRVILEEIDRLGLAPTAIGGTELGAVPMACMVSALAANPLRIFIVRKHVKDHGTGKLIEGRIERGDRVVVVDDVITTGAATLKAIRAVEATGASVDAIFALVDRQEEHLADFDAYADRFHPLLTLPEIRAHTAKGS